MTDVDLTELLSQVNDRTAEKFKSMPSVVIKDDKFDVAKLPVDKPEWHRLTDLVAVMADMRDSTKLDDRRRSASTASIYDAGVGGVVRIFDKFDADFVDIQGDGGFALFWGEKRYERAVCAGITVKTFSSDFTKKLAAKWPEAPSTGFKVGIASGGILAKRVGVPRHLDLQEPVWAGKPVNYAAKAAQQTDPDHLIITGSIWDRIKDNDYLTLTCSCSDPIPLWTDVEVEKIPDDERFGRRVASAWCSTHGGSYCSAILEGKTRREDVTDDQRSTATELTSQVLVQAAAVRDSVFKSVQIELKNDRLERAGARDYRR